MSKSGFVLLPHTTDAYVSATGTTLEEALENAALALFDVMCDVNSVLAKIADPIEATGHDELELLYNWLESLLLKFELEGKVYSKFIVGPVEKADNGLRLTAKILGEEYDRKKHKSKVEVKAVTYHKMEVIHEGGAVTLRFILDL